MTQITVPNLPAGIRVPGVYVGLDPSQAGTGTVVQRALLIGTAAYTAPGSTPPVPYDVPFIASSLATVQTQCGGAGNSLSRMYAAYRQLDTFGEVWCLPIANGNPLNNLSITVTMTGTITGAGVLSLSIGGVLVQVAVSLSDSPFTIEAAVVAACGLIPTLPATVSTLGGLTIKALDTTNVPLDVRLNPGGAALGQVTPPGLTVTINAPSGSVPEPSLANAIANLGDVTYDFICLGPSVAAHNADMTALMDDQTGRWSWESSLFGQVFAAYTGTFSAIDTLGASLNDQHLNVLGVYDSTTPSDEIAARYTATAASSLRNDPALPLTQIPLGFVAPQPQNRFTISERQTLLYDGISTFLVDEAGNTYLERSVTTNQTTPAGVPSTAYLDTETPATLAAVIRQMRTALQTKFARMKLVVDGTRITAGSNMCTSQTIVAEVISQYQIAADLGLVQDVPTFTKSVYGQNIGGGTVNIFCPLNLANQLRIIALDCQFIKT